MNRHQLLTITAVLLSFASTLSVGLDGAQTGWAHVNRRGPTNVSFVNLNTAAIDELRALSGITEAEAEKIVEGRPYKAKDELLVSS